MKVQDTIRYQPNQLDSAPLEMGSVFETQAAQALEKDFAELQALAPELTKEINQFLALQGIPLPEQCLAPDQTGVLNMLSAINDPKSQLDANLPAEEYFSPEELAANLDKMYGAGAAELDAKVQMAMVRTEAALLVALQGGSLEDIIQLLGADNPQSQKLAETLQLLAQLLTQTPPDLQAITQAVRQADWQLLDYITPQPGPERQQLLQILQDQYGVSDPAQASGQPYTGQGGLGNRVAHTGAGKVPPGQFVTKNASEAGAKALSAAQSQIGVREATGNNDGIPAQRFANGRKEPWCGDFVTWCFQQTGHPLPGNQRSLASVSKMESVMKKEGKWFPQGSTPPKEGDIIFFQTRVNSDKGTGRHVGIVEKVENGMVHTVEGNSGNRVRRRSYPLNKSSITGYARP